MEKDSRRGELKLIMYTVHKHTYTHLVCEMHFSDLEGHAHNTVEPPH